MGGTAVDPDPAAMLIYKLLQLNCLAVYWQSDAKLLGTSPPADWMVRIPLLIENMSKALLCRFKDVLKRGIARPKSDPVLAIHYGETCRSM